MSEQVATGRSGIGKYLALKSLCQVRAGTDLSVPSGSVPARVASAASRSSPSGSRSQRRRGARRSRSGPPRAPGRSRAGWGDARSNRRRRHRVHRGRRRAGHPPAHRRAGSSRRWSGSRAIQSVPSPMLWMRNTATSTPSIASRRSPPTFGAHYLDVRMPGCRLSSLRGSRTTHRTTCPREELGHEPSTHIARRTVTSTRIIVILPRARCIGRRRRARSLRIRRHRVARASRSLGDGRAADEDRDARELVVKQCRDVSRGFDAVVGSDPMATVRTSSWASPGVEERCRGCVGAQVDQLQAAPTQDVAEDRERDRVVVAGGGTEDDCPAFAAASCEGGAEPSDEAGGDTRWAVLGGDVEFARGPRIADAAEHRRDELEVDVLGRSAGDARSFDEGPHARLIAGDEAVAEVGPVGLPPDPARAWSGLVAARDGPQIGEAHLPGARRPSEPAASRSSRIGTRSCSGHRAARRPTSRRPTRSSPRGHGRRDCRCECGSDVSSSRPAKDTTTSSRAGEQDDRRGREREPRLQDLVTAVTKAGLVKTLSGPGPFTVFARPTLRSRRSPLTSSTRSSPTRRSSRRSSPTTSSPARSWPPTSSRSR